jgi:hypothetical protein
MTHEELSRPVSAKQKLQLEIREIDKSIQASGQTPALMKKRDELSRSLQVLQMSIG